MPAESSATKLFVLDTNVILHDSGCIHNFAEHDIAIPITVLEELDRFKRGNEDINFQAREFLRRLDDLTGDALSWRDYWRHQRRVAVTYRVSNPTGFAASIVTHGLPLSLLAMLAPYPWVLHPGAILFLSVWIMRWLTACGAARALRFPIPQLGLVVLLASFVETACWIACTCAAPPAWLPQSSLVRTGFGLLP